MRVIEMSLYLLINIDQVFNIILANSNEKKMPQTRKLKRSSCIPVYLSAAEYNIVFLLTTGVKSGLNGLFTQAI